MRSVSIIIPCYNEQATIRQLLDAIYVQTYPRAGLEVVIADGMSEDATRTEIAGFVDTHPELHITIVENPKRIIPSALNRALQESKGEIIIRLDGHSLPYPDYVERCVTDLEMGLGANVGGIWEIQPGAQSGTAIAIAAAASHPLGVGDALYRHTSKPAMVDTVPYGAFKRELLATIGFFDETLHTNEDYEFNARIRKAGGIIWLDPTIRSVYFARSTFSALARQYWRYGFWKWQMLRRYPATLRWRQGLPPLFVAGLFTGLAMSIFLPVFRIFLAVGILIYTVVLTSAGIQVARRQKQVSLISGLPLAISIMHICWGSGFLWGMIRGIFSRSAVPANQ